MPNQTEAEVREDWGNTLRLERHRRRLKQAEVAELARLTSQTVAKAESGRGSLGTFLAIAGALGLDLLGESS